jgi:hypothetical protein
MPKNQGPRPYTEEDTIRRDYPTWCKRPFHEMNMWARTRNFANYLRLPLENPWGEMEIFVKAYGRVGRRFMHKRYLRFDEDGKMRIRNT